MIFRNWILQNFPFLENDFDALTDYELFCKMIEYVKKLVKDNEDFRIKIENLENYVYNLNLQDEVNNKLDEMAEDGTLENLISQYIQLATTYAFNTVNDMKNSTNLINGSFARTSGFHSYNDNGGSLYKIRNITNEDVVDNILIIALNNNNLIAELMINSIMNIECFGAYGDGINDDSVSIQKAVNQGITIIFNNKDYKCNSEIIINKACKLLGSNNQRTYENRHYIDFSDNEDNICFSLEIKGIIFENLNFKGSDNNDTHICVSIINNSKYTFRNCGFYYFNKAISTNRAWSTSFYDSVFEYCETCVDFNGVNTSFLFSGTIFYSSTNGIISNQELDYTNIVGGGFDHVDTCINLINSSYANNITLLNCGFEDYITGIIAIGNSNVTVISGTWVNTERSVETYKGAGRITVINGRTDTALTPNKNDVIYITPILPINANISNPIIAYNQKTAYSQLNNTKFYDFIYPVENGSYIDFNYDDNTYFDLALSVSSTQYPETFHFTKYSTTITKTQGEPLTFTWTNDTTNNRVRITFNRIANIHIKGFMKNSGNIS